MEHQQENHLNWIIVGRLGRAHGIKGDMLLHSFTDPVERLQDYDPLYMKIKNQWVKVEVEKFQIRNKNTLIHLKGVVSPEDAEPYVNADLGVQASQLPELTDNEFYWHDLIGMRVINIQGFEFGVVEDLMATGSNDVLIIPKKAHNQSGRWLIPYTPGVCVVSIDRREKCIKVDWDPEF